MQVNEKAALAKAQMSHRSRLAEIALCNIIDLDETNEGNVVAIRSLLMRADEGIE